ncbi:hypothetical protein PG989_013522 [Apiospora arundinis]
MLRVAVIGGGPGGLVTLKFLKTAHKYFGGEPVDVTLFEAGLEIGGTFVNKIYENAEMVSSKYLTAFSDYRIDADAPSFVTPQDYVTYLNGYCKKFGLFQHIRLGTKVVKVSRGGPQQQQSTNQDGGGGGGYTLTVVEERNDGNKQVVEHHHFDAVAVCNGLHNKPADPRVPGLHHSGRVLHSSEVKTRRDFFQGGDDRPRVAILGAGETAMDMAHLAVTTEGVESVMMCHKNGFFVAPKKIPEPTVLGFWRGSDNPKPIDTAVASLFDTAYCHPRLQRGTMIWTYYTWCVQLLMYLATGTWYGMDQWVGEYAADRLHVDGIFLVKSVRAMPYIAPRWRQNTAWQRLRAFFCQMPLENVGDKRIQVAPWPARVNPDGTWVFPDDTGRPEYAEVRDVADYRPTVVVCCTGYDREFPFLDDGFEPTQDQADVRGVYCAEDVTVGYIGFAQLWVHRLMQWAHTQHHHRREEEEEDDESEPAGNNTIEQIQIQNQTQQQRRALFSHDPNAVPPHDISYQLRPRGAHDLARHKGGVDHESYAYQLALDLGAAPTFTFMVRQGSPRALWTWAMGSNFNPKFRLVGPYSSAENGREAALDIMRGELFRVTSRLGGGVFFFWYSLVPFLGFGAMSLALYAWDFVRGPFVAKSKSKGAALHTHME